MSGVRRSRSGTGDGTQEHPHHVEHHGHLHREPPPPDTWGLAYFIFFWLGVGNLFPWNTFITAAQYYSDRFCGTAFEDDFENFFSVAFMISQTIALALCVKYQHLFSVRVRMLTALTGHTIVLLIGTLLVAIEGMDKNAIFGITIGLLALSGLNGAIMSGAVFGFAGLFPPHYTQALMGGQGLAGVIASLASLITIASGGRDHDFCDDDDDGDDDGCTHYTFDDSAFAYFLVAAVILISCVLLYFVLERLEFTQFYADSMGSHETIRSAQKAADDKRELERALLADVDGDTDEKDDNTTANRDADRSGHDDDTARQSDAASDSNGRAPHTSRDNSHSLNESSRGRELRLSTVSDGGAMAEAVELPSTDELKNVFARIMRPAFSVWFVFSVTIGLFPSLTAKIKSDKQCGSDATRFDDDLFIPFYFTLFNVVDLIGRQSAFWLEKYLSVKILPICSFLRVGFIPLFLLCNVDGSWLPTVFDSVAFPIVFMVFFAFSNGYFSSASMMKAPSLVDTPNDREIAGTIMIFALTLGLLTGAAISFPIVYLGTGSF